MKQTCCELILIFVCLCLRLRLYENFSNLKKKINGNYRPQLDPEASSVRASRPSQANIIDVVNAVK